MDLTLDQLRRRVERAEALFELTGALSEHLEDPAGLGRLVAENIASLVGDAVTVWLLRVGDDELESVAVAHHDPAGRALLESIQLSLSYRDTGGLSRPVMDSGVPLVIADFDASNRQAEVAPAYARWVEQFGISSITALPMRARGRVVGVVGTSRDRGAAHYTDDDVMFMQALADCAAIAIDNALLLGEARHAQESLRRQSQLVDQVSDAIILIDNDSRIASWNAAAEAIYGRRAQEVLGQPAQAMMGTVFLNPDGSELSRQAFLERRAMDGFWRGEIRERHADGHRLELMCSSTAVPGVDGSVSGFVCVNRDLTAQRAASHEATHDPLTGLPNRRLLNDRLTHALARATRRGSGLAVLFVDLDGFKNVNDTYGHDEGDLVLRTCARRLAAAMRASDTVTRLGGDEFVVIAEDIGSVEGAHSVVDGITTALAAGVPVGSDFIRVSASIGIAFYDGHEDAADLVRRADAAMYRAKRTGAGHADFDQPARLPEARLPKVFA